MPLNNESGKSTDNIQRNIHYLKNETVDLTVRIIQDKTDHEQLFGIQPDLEMNYSLNKRNSFTALLKTEFRENKRERIASELDPLTQSKLYNQDLSNSAYLKQRMITPGIRYKHSSGNKHILLSVLHQTITDAGNFKTNATSINRQQTYWLPQAELGLGPMVLSYSKRIAGFLPVDKLDPYTDSTNRLYIVQGNPGLLPAVINEFRFQYSGRPTANLVSINVNAYFQKTDQQLTDHITVNPDGITFIQPVNTDNNISAGISGSVSKQWTDDKNSFYIRVTGNANYYRNEVLYNSSSDRVHSRQAGFTVSGNLTLNRIFSSIPSYGVQYTENRYDAKSFSNTNYIRHMIGLNQTLQFPKRISWENSMAVNITPGLPTNYQKSIFLWNMAVSAHVLKNERGQFRFSAYDILHQNAFQLRNINFNRVSEVQTNSLRRYFLLTSIYNISPGK